MVKNQALVFILLICLFLKLFNKIDFNYIKKTGSNGLCNCI